MHCLDVIKEIAGDIRLCDPYYFFHLPTIFRNKKGLERFLSLSSNLLKKMNFRKQKYSSFSEKDILIGKDCMIFFLSCFYRDQFNYFSVDLEHLRGKNAYYRFS